MRFCDLFISYKIGLKEIKHNIPFTKLPLHKKLAVIAIFACSIFGGVMFMLNFLTVAFITFAILFISILLLVIIDSTQNSLEGMLRENYIPYSQKRMNMVIRILEEYNIDITDIDLLEWLIDEAKSSQEKSDYLATLKMPFKILGAIVIPIIAYVAQKIGDTVTQDQMLTLTIKIIIIIIMLFSLTLAIIPTVKEFIYRDYNKYSELIYDLTQIKIFYSKSKLNIEDADTNL